MHLIIDNGAVNIKVGFQSNTKPSLWSYNKAIKMPLSPLIDQQKEYLCGIDADNLSGHYNMEFPIEEGRIKNWDLQFTIWDDLFERLGIYSPKDQESGIQHQEHNLYLITSINYSQKCYEKMINHIFSNYMTNQISFGIDSINAFYSKGLTTGVSIDSGDSLTSIIPIIQGHFDEKAIYTDRLAGSFVTKKIREMLVTNKNERIHTQKSIDLIKQGCFFYSLDKNENAGTMQFELPDKTLVEVGNERHKLLEVWFNNNQNNYFNMAEKLWDCVQNFDRTTRVNMLSKVLFSGGNTMFKNLEKRFKYEFGKVNENIPISVIENDKKLESSFIGSSMMTTLTNFQDQVIKKEMWQEEGMSLIHRRKLLVLK